MRHIAAKIENSKNPSRRLVAMELRRILAAVDQKSQADWEKMFYGRSGAHNQNLNGSHAFWKAFNELGWTNWTPASDVEVVIRKLQEIGKRLGWDPETMEEEIASTRENFAQYKRYEPEYIDGSLHSDMNDVVLVVMHGPWGFMGYEVSDPDDDFYQLVRDANNALFVSKNIRGGIDIVNSKGEYTDNADGSWVSVSSSKMTDALHRAIAGDDEALILS